jgi:hypothetical protein
MVAIATLIGGFVATTAARAGTPTRPSWASSANVICNTGNVLIRRLPKPTTAGLIVSDFRSIARTASRENSHLSAIARPPNENRRIETFLSTSRKLVALYDQAATAEQENDGAAFSAKVTDINKVGSEYNVLALALGARVCAEAS